MCERDEPMERVVELLTENVRASWFGAWAGWIGVPIAVAAITVSLIALLS